MGIITYLLFNGNCEEAMNFYKDALGGSIVFMQRYGDSPMPGGPDEKDKIMHATMSLCGTNVMFSDAGGKRKMNFGDNFSMSVDCKTDEEIETLFKAMSEGGHITMPLQDTFWSAKFGMCTDKFGVKWMFNYDKPKA